MAAEGWLSGDRRLGRWRDSQGHWEGNGAASPHWLGQGKAWLGLQQGLAVQFFLVPWKLPSGGKKTEKERKRGGEKKGKQHRFFECRINNREVKFQGWLEQLQGVAQPLLSHPAQVLQVQGWAQLQVLPWEMGWGGMQEWLDQCRMLGMERLGRGEISAAACRASSLDSSRSPPSAAFEETKGGSLKHPLGQE